VALIIDQLLHNKPPIIPRDGDQRIDIVFIEDCINAHLSILENGKCDGIYNLGSGVGTSINTILTALTEILNFRQNAFCVPRNEMTVHSIYFDSNKAQDDLGWIPKVDLFEGLKKTVASFNRREKFF
jgi:UDP-glucose 4-epimerase